MNDRWDYEKKSNLPQGKLTTNDIKIIFFKVRNDEDLLKSLTEDQTCEYLLELEHENERLRLLLWQCKKWHIEPRLEALKEIATEEQQGLLNIFNGHLQQAEQLLKDGE